MLYSFLTKSLYNNSISISLLLEANPVTNGRQSPCKATIRPTAYEPVCKGDLDRHHPNMQNNKQTCPVADDSEGTDRSAECLGLNSSASSQSQTKRFSSACRLCYYTFTKRNSQYLLVSICVCCKMWREIVC